MKKIAILGAHISIADGFAKAAYDAHSIDANTMQIFTSSQRQWKGKAVSDQEAEDFLQAVEKTQLQKVMSHGSYLVNLGSPKEDVRQKSVIAFREEIERCLKLRIPLLNFHPGSALDAPKEACLDAVIAALISMEDLLSQKPLTVLFENSAGQGSAVGSTFEELSYLIENTKKHFSVGVCLDTCHLLAAGYDIRTKKMVAETLSQFSTIVGLTHLKAMHLNDSEGELSSHKDRHLFLGEGAIGKEGFEAIMQEKSLQGVPKYLETPGDLSVWKKEIAWLKSVSFLNKEDVL